MSGVFKFLKPRSRPQITDIKAAAGWGVVAFSGAMFVVQPFDWIRKTFIEKPEPEEN